MASERRSAARDDPGDVTITFGPCGRVTFDPPVTLEVARAIKKEIEEGIALANYMCNPWRRE